MESYHKLCWLLKLIFLTFNLEPPRPKPRQHTFKRSLQTIEKISEDFPHSKHILYGHGFFLGPVLSLMLFKVLSETHYSYSHLFFTGCIYGHNKETCGLIVLLFSAFVTLYIQNSITVGPGRLFLLTLKMCSL